MRESFEAPAWSERTLRWIYVSVELGLAGDRDLNARYRTTLFPSRHLLKLIACLWAVMSLIHASKQVASQSVCLRSSYVEISRFFRTRHHGITPTRAPLCSRSATRSFVSLESAKDAVDPDEKLRKTLDDFKATSMHTLLCHILVLTICSSAISMGKTRVEA